MSHLRAVFLVLLLLLGGALSVALYRAEIDTPFRATLAPAFQLLGRPVKSVDRALTRVLPVDDLDEAAYGDAIAARYEGYNGGTAKQQAYVQALLTAVAQGSRKGFRYRAFLYETTVPNAFALPGGVVVVTTGLLSTLHSEAELVAVLAHEVGHVELSHCMDGVRFEILERKLHSAPLGELADLAMTVMMRHAFSKTQEEEADEYAWAWLQQSSYDMDGEGGAFRSLRAGLQGETRSETGHESGPGPGSGKGSESREQPHPLAEYFQSHPHLELREERYAERARAWRRAHGGEMRYPGYRNLRELRPMKETTFMEEWSAGADAGGPGT